MKLIITAILAFATFSFANADVPEMNDSLDAEAVFFATSLTSDSDHDCDESEKIPTTEWTCFARDARGNALGVSTSFTRRDLAAGRAIQSCKRKSSIPHTCRITRCRQPERQCP